MKRQLFLLVAISLGFTATAQDAVQGEKTFKSLCAACHTIGKGKILGPDLQGVTSRRNEKWLISFIRSSQTMVKNNDPVAVKLYNEHNQIPMPDQNLTDAQIKDVLVYIKGLSPSSQKDPVKTTAGQKPLEQTAMKQTLPKTPKVEEWVDAEFKLPSYASLTEIDARKLDDPSWQKIKGLNLALSVQNLTYPNLTNSSVDSLSVKSQYVGKQLFFLIEWPDATPDLEVDADKFCDQLAVQLPLSNKNIPSYMMGNAGGRVHIVHWKAIWQEDCEKGFQDVQVKYPNMWVDVYPGLESHLDRSKRIYAQDISAEHIVETHSTGNMPGTYSQNPISQIKRKEPVEEASAEGFGTLSTQETQQAKGWGEWKDGKWRVCIAVPINTGNVYKANVADRTKVAFAVWDGEKQNIGGRKHFIPWIDLYLEKSTNTSNLIK